MVPDSRKLCHAIQDKEGERHLRHGKGKSGVIVPQQMGWKPGATGEYQVLVVIKKACPPEGNQFSWWRRVRAQIFIRLELQPVVALSPSWIWGSPFALDRDGLNRADNERREKEEL